MSFWEKVCYELDYQGLSRKELAYKIDVPVARINRAIERNSQPFAVDAVRIAKTLNVSLEYLLDFPESKNDIKDLNQGESQQIALYKKYHSIINGLDSMSQDKQKETVEIIRQIIELGKK